MSVFLLIVQRDQDLRDELLGLDRLGEMEFSAQREMFNDII